MTPTRQAPTDTRSSKAADAAADAATSIKDDAVQEAERLRETATKQVKARADDAKDGVADEVSSVGDALRRASDELRSGSPQEQMFASAASSLADFADNLRGNDTGELINRISDFGRRNPIAFLGGAALLGFAGVRMAKASSQHSQQSPQQAYGTTGYASSSPYAQPARQSTPTAQTKTPIKTEAR